MNWRRGLLRVWVISSVIWIAITYTQMWRSDQLREIAESASDWKTLSIPHYAHIERWGFVFGPPLGVLLVGWGALWAYRGFRPAGPSRSS